MGVTMFSTTVRAGVASPRGGLFQAITLLLTVTWVGCSSIKFDVVQEYTFLATLAWCLLWAEIAHVFGLSYEIGAFLAGLSIASSSIAIAIAEHLKPLREFFLILFFFAVGSKLDLRLDPQLLLPAIIFGAILVPLKAYIFRLSFRKSGESPALSQELAIRLAQSSEFSLLWACAVLRRHFPVGENPTRQPLQPEATGANTVSRQATPILYPLASLSASYGHRNFRIGEG